MRDRSYAGDGAGTEDAENIRVHRVTGEDCPMDRCKYEDEHIVVEWDGDEYNPNNSWIAFKGSGIISLDDCQ